MLLCEFSPVFFFSWQVAPFIHFYALKFFLMKNLPSSFQDNYLYSHGSIQV